MSFIWIVFLLDFHNRRLDFIFSGEFAVIEKSDKFLESKKTALICMGFLCVCVYACMLSGSIYQKMFFK